MGIFLSKKNQFIHISDTTSLTKGVCISRGVTSLLLSTSISRPQPSSPHFIAILSIHPSVPAYPCRATGGLMPIASGHWATGGVHPGQFTSLSQDNIETDQTAMHTHAHTQT
ncbi:hypothetical protein CHARACLAT_024206 [Characodon lateralis]|uniref:Uncharacterized protein n=1 Tax=Characodon lateralis TaxID=208331 RepID=A0ABU7D0D2_9TELE|nr:hypothetical protein [Characodon lateralis]